MSHCESIFGNIVCRNKVYCIEASAKTVWVLPIVKNHIVGFLEAQAKHGDSGKFNIVCFSTDVAKWCESLVPCTHEHVAVAEEWLRHIQSRGTCNLVGAIVSALREPNLNCICAVVTQEPDESLDEILDLFAYIGRMTPVHIRLCLTNEETIEEIQTAYDIYLQIAEETSGSFGIVKVNEEKKLVMVKSALNRNMSGEGLLFLDDTGRDTTTSFSSEVLRSTMLQVLPGVYKNEATGEMYPMCSYPYKNQNYQPFDFWKRVSSSQSYLECMKNLRQKNVSNMKSDYVSSLAASIIIGRNVLARKYSDGLYYIGTVKEQIDTDLFKVVLGPYSTQGSDFMATDYLKTKLLDLIDIDDAWKRSIMPGDRVLAPDPIGLRDDSKPFRYVTGTVLDGFASRGYTSSKTVDNIAIMESNLEPKGENSKTLIIEFTHPINKTAKINNDGAIYIPEPFFQRLCLEGAMPKSAREKLYKVVDYPENSMPGYPTSGSKKVPKDFTFSHLNVLKGKNLQVDFLMPPYCLPIYPLVDIMEKEDLHKNLIAKNVWNTGPANKTSDVYSKEDMQIPDSIYTVKELSMKVADQLEKFKHYTSMKTNSDKGFYKRSYIKPTSSEKLTSKVPVQRIHSIIPSQPSTLKTKSHVKYELADNNLSSYNSSKIHQNSQNFNIQDKYYDELEMIRTHEEIKRNSVTFKSDRDKSIDEKVKFNGKFQSLLKPDEVKRTSSILDIGTEDKIKDENNNCKLQQRRLQVERRLEMERDRFCSEEKKHDFHEEYLRAVTNQRIIQEKNRQEKENEMIDRTQSNMRKVVVDVNSTVEQIPSCEIKPKTFEEIDRKKIEFLRKKREVRDYEEKNRNEEALKYIERLEESKKNRCDHRWWEAQQNMLKEYPEKR